MRSIVLLGYGETVPGMTALAQTRKLKLADVLGYTLALTQREVPNFRYNISIEGRACHIEVFSLPFHPQFLAGVLTHTLAVNGATQTTCTISVKDEMHYLYEFTW